MLSCIKLQWTQRNALCADFSFVFVVASFSGLKYYRQRSTINRAIYLRRSKDCQTIFWKKSWRKIGEKIFIDKPSDFLFCPFFNQTLKKLPNEE